MEEQCIHASSIAVFETKRVALERCTWACQKLYWLRKDGLLWHRIGWRQAIGLLFGKRGE